MIVVREFSASSTGVLDIL